jgi:AcrR family transcriptional regulator
MAARKAAYLAARRPDEPAARAGGGRREVIVGALRRCMIEKGYAETSLTDLAKASGMSVSHLLYYFPSKEAALLELTDEILDQVLSDVTSHRDDTPEERIHVLVDNLFIGRAIKEGEFGLVLELTSLAGHRPAVREKLTAYSREMIGYLEDLFAQTPRQPGLSPLDAAEIAGALWMGFFNNVEFDERLDDKLARRLFRRTLLSLANLPAAQTAA